MPAGLFKLFFDLIADFDGVCSRSQCYSDGYSSDSVLFTYKAVSFGPKFHSCYIFKVDGAAIRVCPDDYFAKLLGGIQTPSCSYYVSLFQVSVCRKITEPSERILAVLVFYCRSYVRRCQPKLCKLVRSDPYPHCIILRGVDKRVTYPRYPFEVVEDVEEGIVAHINGVIASVGRKQSCYQQEVG